MRRKEKVAKRVRFLKQLLFPNIGLKMKIFKFILGEKKNSTEDANKKKSYIHLNRKKKF